MYLDDVTVRGAGVDPALCGRPAVQVALHGRTGEVDQSQTGHIHAAVCERWNRHLADALRTSESSVNVPLTGYGPAIQKS